MINAGKIASFWIQTHSGKAFDLSNPRPEMVCIEDIAHALAQINRYTGHARWPYPVGQHSIMVAEIVAATRFELGLAALLHDAPEAYTNDLSSPFKALMVERSNLRGYSSVAAVIDQQVTAAVHVKFGIHLTPEQHRLIKQADLIALATEKRDLFGPSPRPHWGGSTGFVLPEPLEARCEEWTWREAEDRFLAAFKIFGGKA